jgi:ribosomal protein L5
LEDAAKDLTHDHRPQAGHQQVPQGIANFKLRENQPIGCRVTLRKRRDV